MDDKLRLQKLAFSRVLSRDLGLWVSADFYHRGNVENLAAYTYASPFSEQSHFHFPVNIAVKNSTKLVRTLEP